MTLKEYTLKRLLKDSEFEKEYNATKEKLKSLEDEYASLNDKYNYLAENCNTEIVFNNAIDRTAAAECLSVATRNGYCDYDYALSLLNDLPIQSSGNNKYHKNEQLNDIVYVLKGEPTEELRYSVRSVVQNFPHNSIVFYGGKPSHMNCDRFVYHKQFGEGKMARSRSTLRTIMTDDNLTPDIWLFNDDFFIMHPVPNNWLPICNGTLFNVINRIENSRGGHNTRYTDKLRRTAVYLTSRNLDVISYESHAPMLINRKKGLYIIDNFPSDVCFRSCYGNYYRLPGRMQPDVKIVSVNERPDESSPLLSTNNHSFLEGVIGQYIRSAFPVPTYYEK